MMRATKFVFVGSLSRKRRHGKIETLKEPVCATQDRQPPPTERTPEKSKADMNYKWI
jgi:hypothetical protein